MHQHCVDRGAVVQGLVYRLLERDGLAAAQALGVSGQGAGEEMEAEVRMLLLDSGRYKLLAEK